MSKPAEQPYLIKRLLEVLDYALQQKDYEELKLHFSIDGMTWLEDERSDLDPDENPGGMFNERYLSDPVPLDSQEFATHDDHVPFGSETISRSDLQYLRTLLAS